MTTTLLAQEQRVHLTADQRDAIEAWCQMLESGAYTQAEGALRHDRDDTSRYCCLGVACDLYQRSTGEGRWEEYSADHQTFKFNVEGNASVLAMHERVADRLGLPQNPVVLVTPFGNEPERGEYVQKSLVQANDTGHTFEEIAAAIRRTFL